MNTQPGDETAPTTNNDQLINWNGKTGGFVSSSAI